MHRHVVRLLAPALAFAALAGCAAVATRPASPGTAATQASPEVAIATARLARMEPDGSYAHLLLGVRVRNPGTTAIDIDAIELAIALNGERSTGDDPPRRMALAPSAAESFEIERRVAYVAVIGSLVPIAAGRDIAYELSGRAIVRDGPALPIAAKGIATWVLLR